MKTVKSQAQSVMRVLLVLGLLAGCTANTKEETQDAKEQLQQDLTEAKKELERELNKAILEMDDEITKLKTESEEATADVRQQLNSAIAGLLRERQKVVEQVKKVGDASDITWKDIQRDSKAAMESVSDAYDNLRENLKELLKESE